ncbi:hypothetical protein LCGC14_0948650 [marine sediment metagenome]|uniref:Uncharacterized protein n=1 Tax=marine sediment metagenome TaxID=412755 RepID=A0A0F9P408_9ZZZZ
MKIGNQIHELQIPAKGSGRSTRWNEIWSAAESMGEGNALPVEFDSEGEAQSLQGCTRAAKTRGLKLNKRGTTVYVTRAK